MVNWATPAFLASSDLLIRRLFLNSFKRLEINVVTPEMRSQLAYNLIYFYIFVNQLYYPIQFNLPTYVALKRIIGQHILSVAPTLSDRRP